ncbi:TrkH family potassium uptake protein [Persicobacter psychrovividus]|uniref:Potassium transporter n=1 Tax=Persicobacter psychrovividus TaxID=387638 RepID=A0ABM7VAZ1_9BACT|nr:potassium transporter [Persicobacter psychrovividus]
MNWNSIHEKLINQLYLTKPYADKVINATRLIITISVVIGIIYALGFELDEQRLQKVIYWLEITLNVYILNFIIRAIYSLEIKHFIREHKVELALILFVVLNKITTHHLDNYIFQLMIKNHHFSHLRHANFYFGFVSFCLLLVFINEFTDGSRFLSELKMSPPKLITLSFLLLILAGAGTLMLPAMTTAPGSMPFIDALFTSTSAVCVTGLIVVDTATYFTLKGQVVIMFLFQVGGLGIIAFAVFFSGILRGTANIKEQVLLQDYLSSESLQETKETLKAIFKLTFLIELLSSIGIYFSWQNVHFTSIGQKIYFSVFHAISAFCNAGFSLFSNNLFESGVKDCYFLHIVVAATIVFGGLGFGAMNDIFSLTKLRERMDKPWMEWKLGTKVAVWVTFGLILFGTVFYYFLEKDNSLAGLNFGQAIVASMFQSVTTRTAGFNTVDLSNIRTGTVLIMSLLMFIGACSGSTGGGIKTSTFFVIMASFFNNLRGKSRIEFGKRELPKEALFDATSIFIFAIIINVGSVFILTILQEKDTLQMIIFEQFSAFSTCGLSMGLTGHLAYWSKWILINSMFLGRVGTLTFVLALSSSKYTKNYKYPSVNMMIG